MWGLSYHRHYDIDTNVGSMPRFWYVCYCFCVGVNWLVTRLTVNGCNVIMTFLITPRSVLVNLANTCPWKALPWTRSTNSQIYNLYLLCIIDTNLIRGPKNYYKRTTSFFHTQCNYIVNSRSYLLFCYIHAGYRLYWIVQEQQLLTSECSICVFASGNNVYVWVATMAITNVWKACRYTQLKQPISPSMTSIIQV